jgi:thiol-disulfide isomerase/thioredoxin
MHTRHVAGGVFVAFALALTLAARGLSVRIAGVDGQMLAPFEPPGVAQVIFFVATDCPISNSYAPEIQRVCRDYGDKGVSCALMYEDVELPNTRLDEGVRKHLHEYRYAGIPAAIDRERAIAREAQASITPQAVVVDRTGNIRYRGRIDNFYASLGVSRRQVTERDLRDALDAVLSGRPVARKETQAVGCHIVDPAVVRK